MRIRKAFRRALKQEIRRRQKRLQRHAPLLRNGRMKVPHASNPEPLTGPLRPQQPATPNPFFVRTSQPEKWYSRGGVIVGPAERSDPFELMRKVTTSVPEYRETHVNDRGEIVGMDWIMPDWQHFERMLDDDA